MVLGAPVFKGDKMNVFNKIIVIILLVCLALFCFFSIVNEFAGFIDWSEISQKVLDPASDINPYISALALLFIFIISVFVLILEFYPTRSKTASISSSKSGYAVITIDTIEAQVKSSVKKLDGLEDLKIKIYPRSNGIIINMFAKLTEDQDLPAKMQEITKEASAAASKKLGIKVIKTNLTIMGLSQKEPDTDAATGEMNQSQTPQATAVDEAEQADSNSNEEKK